MIDDDGPASVFDTGDPDDDKKLEAYEMWSRKNRSMTWIAEYYKIGRATAHRWVHQGEQLYANLDLLTIMRGRRTEVEFMRMIKEWMVELRDELDPVDQVKAAEVAIKASERQARLGGYDAPVRTDNTIRPGDPGRGPVVDGSVVPRVQQAIETYSRGGDPHDEPDGERSW